LPASFLRSASPDGDGWLWDEFDLAERFGMTVASLRAGRPVPLSAFEFAQWRARDRALATLRQQAKNSNAVQQALGGPRRRGRR
jgi:hypothetical protein